MLSLNCVGRLGPSWHIRVMEDIASDFEGLVKRLLDAHPLACDAARRRNIAAYGLAAFLARSKCGAEVVFQDWKGTVPVNASALAIRGMVLVKDGQAPKVSGAMTEQCRFVTCSRRTRPAQFFGHRCWASCWS